MKPKIRIITTTWDDLTGVGFLTIRVAFSGSTKSYEQTIRETERLIAAAPEMLELLKDIRDNYILPPCGRDGIDALLAKIEGGGDD